MGFRFRKSFKIAPGVRLNVGSRGGSLSVLGTNFSSRGVTTGFSIPGTGISYRTNLTTAQRARERERTKQAADQARQQQVEQYIEERNRKLASVQVVLSDDGTLTMEDADGVPLSASDIRLAWEQSKDALDDVLRRGMAKLNGDVQTLTEIYLDTPDPRSTSAYSPRPFQSPRPSLPAGESFKESAPVEPVIRPLGWLARLFGFLRRRHERKAEAVRSQHVRALEDWSARKLAHEQLRASKERESTLLLSIWEAERDAHVATEQAAKELHERRLLEDTVFMEEVLEERLSALEWPRETNVDFEVVSGGTVCLIDIDLPEIEDFPTKVATLAKTEKRLIVKEKSERLLREEYARHIHGIVFRVTGSALAALPAIQSVVISGYSQRLNKATGHIEDDYLISAVIPRDRFVSYNFDDLRQIDPIEAIGSFTIRRTMSATKVLKPVQPFDASELPLVISSWRSNSNFIQ